MDTYRLQFLKSFDTYPGLTHTVCRTSVFEDVNELLENDEVLKEFPLYVCFKGERAIDIGGVCCDMFSAYWEEAYRRCFDGSTVVVPVDYSEFDMSTFPQVGRVQVLFCQFELHFLHLQTYY